MSEYIPTRSQTTTKYHIRYQRVNGLVEWVTTSTIQNTKSKVSNLKLARCENIKIYKHVTQITCKRIKL